MNKVCNYIDKVKLRIRKNKSADPEMKDRKSKVSTYNCYNKQNSMFSTKIEMRKVL